MLFTIPFLLAIGVVLPVLAWSSHRWLRTTKPTPEALPSAHALGLQTVLLQALIAGLAGLAVWGAGLNVTWLSSLTVASALIATGILVVALVVAWLEGQRPLGPGDEMRRTLRSVGATDPVWLLTVTAAAVSEEFAYRGVLTVILSEPFGIAIGAVGSAVVFGVSHFAQGWRGAAYSAVFGLSMQSLILVSGGLSLAIIVHLSYDLGALAIGRRLAAREREEPAA